MIARRPFLAALAVLAMTPALAGAVDLPDLEGRTVVVVTENAYPPLQFVDPKSGKAIGWEYDAMEEIARRLNFKVEYQNISWDAMIQSVSAGQYDIGMTGISIKDDRREKVDFSVPYMRSEMFMLVRADENRFTDAKSFAAFDKGLVGAQAGTTPFYTAVYDVLDGNEQNPRLRLMETFGASVQALKTGDVDLVLTDGVAGKGASASCSISSKSCRRDLPTRRIGRLLRSSRSWLIRTLRSTRLKKRSFLSRARIQRSTMRTLPSTLALSFGRFGRVGRIVVS